MADDRYVYIPSKIWNAVSPIYSWKDDILPKISKNWQYVTQFENAEKYMFVTNIIGQRGSINILNIDVTKESITSSAKMFIVKTPEKITKSENGWTVKYDGCYWKKGTDFYLTGVFGDPQAVGRRLKSLWVKNCEQEQYSTNFQYFNISEIMDSQLRKEKLSIFSRVSTLTESNNYYPVHQSYNNYAASPRLSHVFLQGLGYLFYNDIYNIQRSSVAYTTFWISNVVELSYNLWAPKYGLSESGILFEKDFSTKTRKYSSDKIEDSIVFYEYPEFFEYQGISSYDYSLVSINPKTGELSNLPSDIKYTIIDVDYTRKVLKYTIPENSSNDWKVYYIGLVRSKYINYGGEWFDQIECMLIIIQEPYRGNYEFIYTYPEGRTELIKELEGTNKFSLAQTNYIRRVSNNPQITIKNERGCKPEIYVPKTCSVVSPPNNIPSIEDVGEFFIYTLDFDMESLTIQYNG